MSSRRSTITDTACFSYTSPSGQYIWTSSNTYTDTLTNAANCDSIITVNLTINNVSDTTITQNGITLTANNTGAIYRWLDCDDGYSVIAGETSASFTATVNGNYAVELSEGDCVDTSACIAINSVGIVENSFGQELKLYPNPSQGKFTLDLGRTYGKVQLSLYGLTGRQVLSKTYSGTGLIELNITEAKGVYMLKVETENDQAIIKLMKE